MVQLKSAVNICYRAEEKFNNTGKPLFIYTYKTILYSIFPV